MYVMMLMNVVRIVARVNNFQIAKIQSDPLYAIVSQVIQKGLQKVETPVLLLIVLTASAEIQPLVDVKISMNVKSKALAMRILNVLIVSEISAAPVMRDILGTEKSYAKM